MGHQGEIAHRQPAVRLDEATIADFVIAWAEKYQPDVASVIAPQRDDFVKLLAIGRDGKKPRKDFAVYADVRPYMDFFYDELFTPDYSYPENLFE